MILLERTERRGEIVNSEQALDNESVRVNNGKSLRIIITILLIINCNL